MARVLPEINFLSFTGFYCTLPEKHIENTFIFVEFVPLLINFIAFTVFNNLKWNLKWPWKLQPLPVMVLCIIFSLWCFFWQVTGGRFVLQLVLSALPSLPSPPCITTHTGVGTAVKQKWAPAQKSALPNLHSIPGMPWKRFIFSQLHKSKLQKVKTTPGSHQLVKVWPQILIFSQFWSKINSLL